MSDQVDQPVQPDELCTHNLHLDGERVHLRPMTEDDWPHVLDWNADPEVLIWSDGIEEPRPPEDTKGIYRAASRSAYVFIIELAAEPIGECWLQKMNLPEISARFWGLDLRRIEIVIGRKDLWGKGLGSDAIRTLVAFGFEEERADAIFGIVDPGNTRSWQAFRKAGPQELQVGEKRTLVIWRKGESRQ